MTLFNYNKNLPTDTVYQETFNINVSEVIGRILTVALNQTEIQGLIDSLANNPTASLITFADTPVAVTSGGFYEVDTTSGAVTFEIQDNTVVDEGFTFEVVRVAGANNITVDCTTNSCTIDGAASNTTISSSYAPKKYKLLSTTANDYLEV